MVMVVSCLPVAVFCNALRVTTTGLLIIYGREELARGTSHQLLGIVTLGIALSLFSLIGFVLRHLWIVEEAQPSDGTEHRMG